MHDALPARPRHLSWSQHLGAAAAALLVGSVAGALVLGFCFGISVHYDWSPAFALGAELASGLAALGTGVWMLRLAVRAERASGDADEPLG